MRGRPSEAAGGKGLKGRARRVQQREVGSVGMWAVLQGLLTNLLMGCLTLSSILIYLYFSSIKRLYTWLLPWRWEQRRIQLDMDNAAGYAQFVAAANAMDKLAKRDSWKKDPNDAAYDAAMLTTRLHQLQVARLQGNWKNRMSAIRENLQRGIDGTDNQSLHTHCAIGTKKLIASYTEEVAQQLEDVSRAEGIGAEVKARFFTDSRQAFGRSALLLSGGISFGMYHFGVVKCLFEQRCLPRVICGASIGALIAALVGIHTDDEIPDMWERPIDPSSLDTLPVKGSARRKIIRLLKQGVLMDVQKLVVLCKKNLGDMTFQEAFTRTGRITNITLPKRSQNRGGSQLLNYITAPNVLLWSAACASCAHEGLYDVVELMVKDESGNITAMYPAGKTERFGRHNDLPMHRLSELFNINHFVISQVQPHIVPYQCALKSSSRSRLAHRVVMWMGAELFHRLRQLSKFGWWPSGLLWVREELESVVEGDITIVPQISLSSFLWMFRNPSQAMISWCMHKGEQSTYRYVSRIKNRCRIEMALQQCTDACPCKVSRFSVYAPHTPRPASPRARVVPGGKQGGGGDGRGASPPSRVAAAVARFDGHAQPDARA